MFDGNEIASYYFVQRFQVVQQVWIKDFKSNKDFAICEWEIQG